MATYPHLNNAPISEALIDIRVPLLKEKTLEDLSQFHDHISGDYPERRERKFVEGAFSLGKGAASFEGKPGRLVGYHCFSRDRLQVVQARLDGFTFNRLKPYQDWDHLVGQARPLWDLYRRVAEPERVLRVAVRYINKLELPLPFEDFRKWLRTVPEVSDSLGCPLAGYAMTLNAVFPEESASALIQQRIVPGDYRDRIPIVFDIDAFRQVEFLPNDDALWECLAVLRGVKNKVFFGSLTTEALELFA